MTTWGDCQGDSNTEWGECGDGGDGGDGGACGGTPTISLDLPDHDYTYPGDAEIDAFLQDGEATIFSRNGLTDPANSVRQVTNTLGFDFNVETIRVQTTADVTPTWVADNGGPPTCLGVLFGALPADLAISLTLNGASTQILLQPGNLGDFVPFDTTDAQLEQRFNGNNLWRAGDSIDIEFYEVSDQDQNCPDAIYTEPVNVTFTGSCPDGGGGNGGTAWGECAADVETEWEGCSG